MFSFSHATPQKYLTQIAGNKTPAYPACTHFPHQKLPLSLETLSRETCRKKDNGIQLYFSSPINLFKSFRHFQAPFPPSLYKAQLSSEDRARFSFVSVTESAPLTLLRVLSTVWAKTFQYTYLYICGIDFFPPAFFLTTLHYIYLPSIKGDMNEPLCPSLPAMLAPDELVPGAQSFLFSTAPCCFNRKSRPGHT